MGRPSPTTLFDLQQVARGVYAALARPQYKLNCNAAIVELEEGMLVVDTHSKPSAARALIAQIKALTDKPVRYVFNTHFHWDHWQGNAAYPEAYPQGVTFIASEAARRGIRQRGLPRIQAEVAALPAEIESLRRERAQTKSAAQIGKLDENIRQAESYFQELRQTNPVVPELTFARRLSLRRKKRVVRFRFLGRGHTDGDAVAHLPAERVLISGDLVQGFMPYLGDGYPDDWVRTLAALERLDFEHIIPGHGVVLRGKEQLRVYREYLTDLMGQVAAQHARGAGLQETLQCLDLSAHRARLPLLAREDEENIEKAYRVVSEATG